MRFTITVTPADIEDAIYNALGNVSEVSGVGANSDSTYEVTNVSVTGNGGGDGGYVVEVEVERVEGLFASKDEVAEGYVSQVDGETMEVRMEVTY